MSGMRSSVPEFGPIDAIKASALGEENPYKIYWRLMPDEHYIKKPSVTGGTAEASLEEFLTFERLLFDLSARFANVPIVQVETEIDSALMQIQEFLGFDRSNFFEFTADGRATILGSIARVGVERHPLGPAPAFLNWYLGQVRAGKVMRVQSIEDLPPEANKSHTIGRPASAPVSDSRSVSVAASWASSALRRSARRGNGRTASLRD